MGADDQEDHLSAGRRSVMWSGWTHSYDPSNKLDDDERITANPRSFRSLHVSKGDGMQCGADEMIFDLVIRPPKIPVDEDVLEWGTTASWLRNGDNTREPGPQLDQRLSRLLIVGGHNDKENESCPTISQEVSSDVFVLTSDVSPQVHEHW
ncbi:hypothetical protein IV203_027930 [Nitzschia inconspicua]|uniref:Uncharacterized protein n=1 Tax=Nitzschia inconspicua TaxID=303405 RepID=A0A9K3Q6I6_9STRA|nr:hypothetical protein IV203_027930 [Nitzschia inconspicua]